MQRSQSMRECWNCKQDFPESETELDFKKNPLLMDPDHPGLAHWKVCEAKMTPAQINSAIAKWLEQQKKKSPWVKPEGQQPFGQPDSLIPKTKTTEEWILEKNDENWKILNERFERLEKILESYRNQQIVTNSMIRSIMRHVGIPDT